MARGAGGGSYQRRTMVPDPFISPGLLFGGYEDYPDMREAISIENSMRPAYVRGS
jgi:hypothetical protein